MAGYSRSTDLPSGIPPSHQYNANAELHFVGGDPQSAGFCDGPGPGMALEQNPFLPPTRPGGANGQQCLNGPREQLNITSRCITRSLQYVGTGLNGQRLDAVQAKHLPSREELYNVVLCYDADSWHNGDAKGRHSPGVYCTSLGRLGGIKPARRTDCWLEQARNGGTARDRNAERAEGNRQLAVTASP